MDLSLQKRLAAKAANVSKDRVKLNSHRIEDIKEAITKSDIRSLMGDGAIVIESKKGISRLRAKERAQKRKRNSQNGPGRKKGKKGARIDYKRVWINKVRSQRELVRKLKARLTISDYHDLMSKIKGGYFRSIRHIKLYLDEHKLVKEDGKKQD